jgi:hypothetical protein
MAASTTAATRPNVFRITGTIDEAGDAVLYKFRSAPRTAPETVRISLMGTFTGTIDVRVCNPGVASGNEANQYKVVSQYTAPDSVVFEPGGSCDIYLYASAWTSGSCTASIGK